MSEIEQRLLLDVITRGATSLFGNIADEMERFEAEKRNIRTVEVVSAEPLNNADQEALRQKLSSYVNAKVTVRFSVDKGLLSGMLVKIGDTIIDNTVKTDLENIRRQLMAVSAT
jgi:F-type H+-transporting ATPase subunit delta